jgi:hypothetical protein
VAKYVPALTDEQTIEEALLQEYQAHLAAICYDGGGAIAALVTTPEMDRHDYVNALRIFPGSGVEGQYPGKQWWRGKLVPGRQVSAINAEVLDVLGIDYDVTGDNLIIRGLDLSQLKPGDTLRIGDAVLTVTPTPHRPCTKLAVRTSLTKKQALSEGRLRGIMLDAREPATICMGDWVELLILS